MNRALPSRGQYLSRAYVINRFFLFTCAFLSALDFRLLIKICSVIRWSFSGQMRKHVSANVLTYICVAESLSFHIILSRSFSFFVSYPWYSNTFPVTKLSYKFEEYLFHNSFATGTVSHSVQRDIQWVKYMNHVFQEMHTYM